MRPAQIHANKIQPKHSSLSMTLLYGSLWRPASRVKVAPTGVLPL